MFFAGFGEAFIAIERQVRNNAGGNTRVLAHLHKVLDARSESERAVGHDVDGRFGMAFVNLLHDFKPLLGGVALFKRDRRSRLDGGTVGARVAESKLNFKDVRATLHKGVGDSDGCFCVREPGNEMGHEVNHN